MRKVTCVTETGLQRMIRRDMRREDQSMSDWGNENGIVPQRVSAFLRGVEPAGNQIPAAYGLAPITVFVRKDDPLYIDRIKTQRENIKPKVKPKKRRRL